MAEISKISAVAIANVAKVDAVTKANIADINGLTIPSAAAGLLLDDYPTAAAAYSLRLLRTAYTGSAIEVRRDSDNTTQDIGFDSNGDLDTAAIGTFVGSGNNGYVRTLYDQSGNSRDASQTNTGLQPLIYDGTSVITENGKSAIEFDGSNDVLSYGTNIGTDFDAMTIQVVATIDTVQNSLALRFGANPNRIYVPQVSSSNVGIGWGGNMAATFGSADTTQHLYSVYGTSTTDYVYQDSTSATLSNRTGTSTSQIFIGGYASGNNPWAGNIQEVVIWSADRFSNRTGIESNLTTYYGL